jgi:hypothetical protein
VPEVIDDGVTGFIVESEEEPSTRSTNSRDWTGERCASALEERFFARRMARAYESHYRQLVDGTRIERLTPTLNVSQRIR